MRVQSSQRPPPTAPAPPKIQLGYLASLFIGFGILGLVTAAILAIPADKLYGGSLKYTPPALEEVVPVEAGEQFAARDFAMLGPFTVTRPGQGIWISVGADIPINSWLFIEGELLDAKQNYLMGFGDELWHETGYDDGAWDETDNEYNLNLSMPEAGEFYLNFKTQGESRPHRIRVNIYRTNGSSVPHLIFGILALLTGLVLNEIANRTFTTMLSKAR